MENLRLITKLNLLKEEVLLKIKTKGRILTKVRSSAIIVINLVIVLMNVGSRRIKRLRKPILLKEVTLMHCC